MKLKQCPDCQKSISTDALWCIHCGAIKFSSMITFMATWALASIPAVLILAVIGYGIGVIAGLTIPGK